VSGCLLLGSRRGSGLYIHSEEVRGGAAGTTFAGKSHAEGRLNFQKVENWRMVDCSEVRKKGTSGGLAERKSRFTNDSRSCPSGKMEKKNLGGGRSKVRMRLKDNIKKGETANMA